MSASDVAPGMSKIVCSNEVVVHLMPSPSFDEGIREITVLSLEQEIKEVSVYCWAYLAPGTG